EFDSDFPGGVKDAQEKVVAMAEEAKQAALERSARRVQEAVEGRLEAAQKQEALLEGIKRQTIGPIQPESTYSFAFLHAAIIRRLLAANERFALPIARIYPRRFEIIIDLNLEHPGGREAARQWVIENIEK